MPSELHLFNPSPYPRSGYVTLDWHSVSEAAGIEPERLALLDAAGAPIPYQLDPIAPHAPRSAAFSFLHTREIPPMTDDYQTPSTSVRLVGGQPTTAVDADDPRVYVGDSHVVLSNRHLVVRLNLTPALRDDGRAAYEVYAGAATSVLLRDLEHLDAFRAAFGHRMLDHDPEKRCMQLAHIRLSNPAWAPSPCQQVNFFDRPYRLVSSSNGPVRACVTISADFDYAYHSPSRKLKCALYRVLSLYRDADFVMDEVFVETPEEEGAGTHRLNFTSHYFSYMDMGKPYIAHYEEVPDWFVIGCPVSPFQGYGFATDIHARRISHPHPGFPDPRRHNKTFSWQLFRAGRARSIHIFMRLPLRDIANYDANAVRYEFTHHVGHAWYEHIFKPLVARAS